MATLAHSPSPSSKCHKNKHHQPAQILRTNETDWNVFFLTHAESSHVRVVLVYTLFYESGLQYLTHESVLLAVTSSVRKCLQGSRLWIFLCRLYRPSDAHSAYRPQNK